MYVYKIVLINQKQKGLLLVTPNSKQPPNMGNQLITCTIYSSIQYKNVCRHLEQTGYIALFTGIHG